MLLGLVTIDRDAKYFDGYLEMFHDFQVASPEIKLVVICRESDALARHAFEDHEVLLEKDYEIKGKYNLEILAKKRNKLCAYAVENHCPKLLCIDTDIRISRDQFSKMVLLSDQFESVVLPICGSHQKVDFAFIAGAGAGCLLLSGRALKVPFAVGSTKKMIPNRPEVIGEDIGFFLNMYEQRIVSVIAYGEKGRHLSLLSK
jgi:hypothetical protein